MAHYNLSVDIVQNQAYDVFEECKAHLRPFYFSFDNGDVGLQGTITDA
jgi:hypothetical protein